MRIALLKRTAAFAVLLAVAVTAIGCGRQAGETGSTGVSDAVGEGRDLDGDGREEGEGLDHGGWWCVEHGVPEEQCSMCNTKVAEKFKEKGDWCEEHNRAESQCFKCDPARAEKFARLYEAKFGQTPPEPSE